ncbi:tyrosinase [Aspergillus flavus]|uniref:tyrosinase n=1 Tax=Aspergillus flavus (strain ATCC 200026 / FGSC A1120 / IAM 13836 / NRRL 3357 / JCM 12722 / SRRC 167) TaxID=332952 RepID=A0A7U2MCW3_ASPFN|nr:tyrosinase [Aspergillus flavus]QRD81369.1 tyrosinase [Aspergillus flavus]
MASVEPIKTFEIRQKGPVETKAERKSIRDLNEEELDKLIEAWRWIQDPARTGEDSFFYLAGLHGEPFRGAGYNNSHWWGGYCHHGNILFPTWHRAYLMAVEKALRKACPDVSLPYWDESDDETAKKGIPLIFTQKEYKGKPNPLYSYTFSERIVDRLAKFPDADYSKPQGYKTCRYPYSGLCGQDDIAIAQQHNNFLDANFDQEQITGLLNSNVTSWLNLGQFTDSEGKQVKADTRWKIRQCLLTEEYTVFSNTTSAQRWNDEQFHPLESGGKETEAKATSLAVPLESPHNDMHLAIGGVQIPGFNVDQYAGANGDMGENDTASFDPIFYFHHCFIDYLFWTWQTMHKKTEASQITILPEYPGTNSVDSQGPTPGISGNTWLTLDTPLDPFRENGDKLTSNKLLTLKDLPYTYKAPTSGTGSVFNDVPRLNYPLSPPILRVSGINRASIAGSFALAISQTDHTGKAQVKGIESVLSRWHVQGCANCQTHLSTTAFVPLFELNEDDAKRKHANNELAVHLHTRGNPGGQRVRNVTVGTMR